MGKGNSVKLRCGEALAVVKHCGLGGLPHEQMLKGFPDLSKVLNPKGIR